MSETPGGGLLWYVYNAVEGPLLFATADTFVGYRTILGMRTDCFQGDSLFVLDSVVCVSEEGLPLAIDSLVGIGTGTVRLSFEATEVRPMPTEAELLTPILPGAMSLDREVDRRGVQLTELALPPLPFVQEYFGDTVNDTD
ncbi:MAG TPA: hypothetical protein VNM43_02920 [Dehalococcoidia bacterium]|nr:hypothetical protein [Dehalococcoidia bacterium]